MSIPVKFREVLTERYEERLIVTTDSDDCLVAYPPEEWRLFEEKLRKLSTMKKEVKDFMRVFYSNAEECPLDKQGRILIPPALRAHARCNKEVVLIGGSNKIEIWDIKVWKQKEIQLRQDYGNLSEALSGLGL